MIVPKNIRTVAVAMLGLGLAVFAAACDNPVESDHEEHADPEGLVVELNGEEIVRVEGDSITGSITVAVGEQTPRLDIHFIDHDGHEIHTDEDTYLEAKVGDESIAEFEQDTPGEFGGHIRGKTAGTTTIMFKLMHGVVGSGHPDFESPDIPVEVTS